MPRLRRRYPFFFRHMLCRNERAAISAAITNSGKMIARGAFYKGHCSSTLPKFSIQEEIHITVANGV